MKLKTWFGVIAVALTVFAVQAQEMTDDAIKERIKPVGSVHVAGANADAQAAEGGGGTRSGEDVFGSACVACHGSGVLGAPKVHVAADWQPRVDKGFDTLMNHALNGFNAMPPRGTCGNCSDDEIKAAIEYMIEGI
ncbi:cytochrome c5 family protein [Alteromonas pelagimontana]|uniref:Cytochrome c5 family protein n=1 Tax=Alteromonas pelagimontana TaxID=1858656 RepID=A0A6M4MFS9_9ALTE|nr:cytochrome c5 family protein [Alteromonas pelagimontana]QJR81046.1 cytochrome c5 family protein [Alteromonas pelagimontana]